MMRTEENSLQIFPVPKTKLIFLDVLNREKILSIYNCILFYLSPKRIWNFSVLHRNKSGEFSVFGITQPTI